MNDTAFHVKENAAVGERYAYKKHKSGLDIYVIPKPFSTAYAILGTRYGSVDNRFKRKADREFTIVPDGIAHYLEHKMFENEDGTDTFARFAQTGANANAFTGFDMTAYLFSCTENFDASLDILLDYVTHPYFTPENVQKEQGIIAQEIRMEEDTPGNALMFSLLRAMYEKHNVRLEIAGTTESISHINADLLYRCYRTFYNLRNMALCVCGNITPEQVEAACDRVLTEAEPFDSISEQPDERETVFMRRTERHMQVSQPMFAIGIKDIHISRDPRERMKKSAAIQILGNMLFGQSGTFFNHLYSQGLLSGPLGIWGEHNRSYSFLAIDGESNDPDTVFARFEAFVGQTRSQGLDREEFMRSRRSFYAQFLKDFDSTAEIANNFLRYAFDGGDMFDYADIIGNMTFEEADAVFRDLFRTEHFALSVVSPQS